MKIIKIGVLCFLVLLVLMAGGCRKKYSSNTSSSNNVQATAPADCLAKNFKDNGDGTIQNLKTGLIWSRCFEHQQFDNGKCLGKSDKINTRSDALRFAKESRRLGKSDWRLPSREELDDFYDICEYGGYHHHNKSPMSPWYQYSGGMTDTTAYDWCGEGSFYAKSGLNSQSCASDNVKYHYVDVLLVRSNNHATPEYQAFEDYYQRYVAVPDKQRAIDEAQAKVESKRAEAKYQAEQKRAAAAEAKCMRSASCRAEKQQQQVINAIRDADRNASRRAACLSEVRNCEANCRNGFYSYPGICIQQQCQRNCN